MRQNKIIKTLLTFVLGCSIIMAASSQSYGAVMTKPVIAIKEAVIGTGVRSYVRKYLNINTIRDEMEAAIQKNRKFDLTSRAKDKGVLKAIREEQRFAQSELSAGNAAVTGKIKNANFLILPTVQDFKFYRSSKAVPNLEDKYQRIDSGMLEIQAKLVDTSSGLIKTTFYMKSSFATRKKIVNTKYGAPNSVYFTKMAKSIAVKMIDQLVDAVFPIRILNIQEKMVFINRGKDGGLKRGQILKVFRPGVALIDPDTGEDLGSTEAKIGKIKVIRINPKFTIAEITNGSGAIKKGDIIRE